MFLQQDLERSSAFNMRVGRVDREQLAAADRSRAEAVVPKRAGRAAVQRNLASMEAYGLMRKVIEQWGDFGRAVPWN
jgi:hypothetical protein